MSTIKLHPVIDKGIRRETYSFSSGTLVCACVDKPVKVHVAGGIAYNHLCGCTKCWKPEGAIFSIVAVASHDNVTVQENGEKLSVVDPDALILRHACMECGVHMYGSVEREHPYSGLDFVHPERFDKNDWAEPRFAAFVSSVIESGTHPDDMDDVRDRLRELGLEPYDAMSPEIMDMIATWHAKKSGVLKYSSPNKKYWNARKSV